MAVDKSKIGIFDLKSMEIELIKTDFISNSTIGKMRILSSKIEKIEKNIFKNARFERCEMDGNRVMAMDSEAFYGQNQVSSVVRSCRRESGDLKNWGNFTQKETLKF